MTSAYVALWQVFFALALVLELPLVALASPAGKRARSVIGALVGNALTHPLLWFVWPRLLPHLPALLLGEACAVVVEAGAIHFIAKVPPRQALVISAAVNLYSWAVGEALSRVLFPRMVAFVYGG